MNDSETEQHLTGVHVSMGAGVAIAGIWLSASALTAILLLITFVWDKQVEPAPELSTWSAVTALLLLAAPMIAAFAATRLVLNKD